MVPQILWPLLPKWPENLPNNHDKEIETLTIDELLHGQWSDTPPASKHQHVTSPTSSNPETVTSHLSNIDQPLQEFWATESFWEDYLRQDVTRLLEPTDLIQKRKFCD